MGEIRELLIMVVIMSVLFSGAALYTSGFLTSYNIPVETDVGAIGENNTAAVDNQVAGSQSAVSKVGAFIEVLFGTPSAAIDIITRLTFIPNVLQNTTAQISAATNNIVPSFVINAVLTIIAIIILTLLVSALLRWNT